MHLVVYTHWHACASDRGAATAFRSFLTGSPYFFQKQIVTQLRKPLSLSRGCSKHTTRLVRQENSLTMHSLNWWP